MPETYGLPEPREERSEQAKRTVVNAIAGQGTVRRIVLYVAAGLLAVSPIAPLAIAPLILLMATDHDLT